jgi:hypothetical protein
VNPHDWDHQEKKHGIEHAKNIELTGLLGGASEDTSGSQPRRTTKGVTRRSPRTSPTPPARCRRRSSRRSSGRWPGTATGTRTLFASALVLGVLNNFAQGKLQLRQGEDTYGLAVTHYVSPFGRSTRSTTRCSRAPRTAATRSRST